MGVQRDRGCGRANGGDGGMNGDLVLWMDARDERRERGGDYGLDGEIQVFVRVSLLARLEPVLLGHHVPGRLSWQHFEVDVEAWMGTP